MPLANQGLTALRAHERASTMPKLHRAKTVAWGLRNWARGCLMVVRHGSTPAWQNMPSLLLGVGLCTPHHMPSGGKAITYFSKNLPLSASPGGKYMQNGREKGIQRDEMRRRSSE